MGEGWGSGARLGGGRRLAQAGGAAVLEERKGTAVALPAGYTALDARSWGDTEALFARFTGGATRSGGGD